MITRFIDITNSLASLGKEYTQVKNVRKILHVLIPNWEKKTTAIEETNDLSTMSLENLIGNLMAYDVQLEDMYNQDDDEEEMAMLSKKFRKFLKQGKFNPICFNCNKTGHMKKDCPLLKNKGKFKSKKFKKKKDFKHHEKIVIPLPLTKKKPLNMPISVTWRQKKMRYNFLNF